MIVIVSGASGFIGSALTRALLAEGHQVKTLVRHAPRSLNEIQWDVEHAVIDTSGLEGADAVVHLAGESLVQRWTTAARRRIRESRVKGTTLLSEAFASLSQPPRVLLSGSAIGIYGNRAGEILDEASSLGNDFLASVCRDWEAASEPARSAGARVVNMRTGLVLGRSGGVLAKMLPPFRVGLGGRFGSGDQWMSCIALSDYLRLTMFCLTNDHVAGPVNFVGPDAVTNQEFTQTLARALHRPALLPVPAFALDLVMGEMAKDTLLTSQRVHPARALAGGFAFDHPTLESAISSALRDQRT